MRWNASRIEGVIRMSATICRLDLCERGIFFSSFCFFSAILVLRVLPFGQSDSVQALS